MLNVTLMFTYGNIEIVLGTKSFNSSKEGTH